MFSEPILSPTSTSNLSNDFIIESIPHLTITTHSPMSPIEPASHSKKGVIHEYFDTAAASDGGESPSLTDAESDFDCDADSDAYSPPSVPLYPFHNQVGGHASLLRFSAKAVCKPLTNHEKHMYEHFENNHPEILPFISNYLGVLNVTFTTHNDKIVPEVLFEKNRHILPDEILKRYLGTDEPAYSIESPGVTRVNKKLQEQIFHEACSPKSLNKRLKDLSLNKRHRKGHSLLRRHSFSETAENGEFSNSKSPLMRVKRSDVRLGSSFDEKRPLSDYSDDEHSHCNTDVESLELPIQRRPSAQTCSSSTKNLDEEDSVLFHMEDVYEHLPKESTSHLSKSFSPAINPISPEEKHLNPWSLEIYKSTMVKMAECSSTNTMHQFLLLNDLTYNIKFPCVLDLKMGTRQYGIYATKEKRDSQMKKCEKSTSKALGVRVCGMQIYKEHLKRYVYHDKYYGRKLSANSFRQSLCDYLHDGEKLLVQLLPNLISKLRQLFDIVRSMPGHRFYASSLLFIYDGDSSNPNRQVEIKIIDFANCVHQSMYNNFNEYSANGYPTPNFPPSNNGPDHGYLRGLATLLQEFIDLWYLHATTEDQQLYYHEMLVDKDFPGAY